MAEQQSPVAPVLLTLLLCEKVITDAVSRQVSLIGLVSNVNAPQFPVRSPNLFIFTEITGGHGVTASAGVGEFAAHLLLGKPVDRQQAAWFSPSRF